MQRNASIAQHPPASEPLFQASPSIIKYGIAGRYAISVLFLGDILFIFLGYFARCHLGYYCYYYYWVILGRFKPFWSNFVSFFFLAFVVFILAGWMQVTGWMQFDAGSGVDAWSVPN